MYPINDTTYEHHYRREAVRTIVGDEKQDKALPRFKLEKWDNEVNISLGLADVDGYDVTHQDGIVSFHKNGMVANFYQSQKSLQPLESIRRVFNGNHVSAIEASAQFEMFNHVNKPGQMIMSHYVVDEPTLAVFDQMPASSHVNVVNQNGVAVARDFNYRDKSSYHPPDIPIPTFDTIPLVRFFSPYTNPYFMDGGLHNIVLQWYTTNLTSVAEPLAVAIESVLELYGVKVARIDDDPHKLFFKHGNRFVKFYSAQEQYNGLYTYINFASAYNKAYDFYRPDVEKDIRNDLAYGLKFAYPSIKHSVVNEIMQQFAELLKVPLYDQPFNSSEEKLWLRTQDLQNNYDWIALAQRQDAAHVHAWPSDALEFEVVYQEKPDSNVIKLTANQPKSLVAYYQGEFDIPKMFEEGTYRSPHICKSLALYHSSKRDNEYKVGKVGHIYRPIAWDSSGNKVFCDFLELQGLEDGAVFDLSQGLTIEIPHDFLNNATYPITVDPTMGYLTAGASTQSDKNVILGTVATGPSSALVFRYMCAYVDNASVTQHFQAALYDNAGSFNFLTTTLESDTISFASWIVLIGDPWFQLTASTTYNLAGWGFISNTGGYNLCNMYFDSGGGPSFSLAQTYSSRQWPSTLAGKTTQTNRQYSIFAAYGAAEPYPIMAGLAANLSSAANFYQFLASTNDNAFYGNQARTQSITASSYIISDMRAILGNAPSGGNSRNFQVNQNYTVATSLNLTITDPLSVADSSPAAMLLNANDTFDLLITATASTTGTGNIKYHFRQMPLGATPLQLLMSGDNTSYSGSTKFIGIQDTGGFQSTAAAATQYMPQGTSVASLINWIASTQANLTAGQFYTCQLNVNGIVQSTLTLGSANSGVAHANGINVAITQGMPVYIQVAPTGTPATGSMQFGVDYKAETAGQYILLSSNNSSVSTTTDSYNNWFGSGGWNTNETKVSALAYRTNLQSMYVRASVTPASGKTRTITFRNNGNNTDATVNLGSTNAIATWSGTIKIKMDDLIDVAHTSSGTPAASNVKYGLVLYSFPFESGDFFRIM